MSSHIGWTKFRRCPIPQGLEQDAIDNDLTVWLNSRYQVQQRELGAGMTYLSIKRLKKEAVHDWRELQRVKNDLCGEQREGMELYPAMARVVDTANSYHLFVLPLGTVFNVGFVHGAEVHDDLSDSYQWGEGRQRPLPSWMPRTKPLDPSELGRFASGVGTDGDLQLTIKIAPWKAGE